MTHRGHALHSLSQRKIKLPFLARLLTGAGQALIYLEDDCPAAFAMLERDADDLAWLSLEIFD